MRKLIVIFLLFASVSYGQWLKNNNSTTLQLGEAGLSGVVSSYEPEALAYFARFTTQPTSARKTLMNTTMKMLKDSLSVTSLTSVFDYFYILAYSDTVDVKLDWFYNRSCVNKGGEWVIDSSWNGDGSSALDLNFNPSTNAVNSSLNSVSYGVYSRTDLNDANTDLGGFITAGQKITICLRGFGATYPAINIGISTYPSFTYSTSKGFFIFSRTDTATVTTTKNGVQVNQLTNTYTAGIPNSKIYLGADCNGGTGAVENSSPRDYIATFGAKGLTVEQMRKIYNCIYWYVSQIGLANIAAIDGNSLMLGLGSPALPIVNYNVFTLATNGGTIAQLLSNWTTNIAPYYNRNTTKNINVIYEGANAIGTGVNKDSIYNQFTRYCQQSKGYGFKVAICTILPFGTDSTENSTRLYVNNLIRSNWANFADALIDVTTNTTIGADGCQDSTTYYNVDKLHLTAQGYDTLRAIIYNGVTPIL